VKAKTVITMSFQQHQHELFESTLSGNVNIGSSAECSFYVRIIGKCACHSQRFVLTIMTVIDLLFG
jgi:hypothetical protein